MKEKEYAIYYRKNNIHATIIPTSSNYGKINTPPLVAS